MEFGGIDLVMLGYKKAMNDAERFLEELSKDRSPESLREVRAYAVCEVLFRTLHDTRNLMESSFKEALLKASENHNSNEKGE